MSNKPDWNKSPDWAKVLLQQNGFCGICYCWAESHDDGSKAIWHDDLARSWMCFELRKTCWEFTEQRP